MKTVDESPPVIVTVAGTETQAVSRAVSVTTSPPAGAAMRAPALRNSSVCVTGMVEYTVCEAFTILSVAVVETVLWSGAKLGLVAVTVTVPSATPWRVPLALVPPCGIVTVGVRTPTKLGLLLTRLITAPPAGAGWPRVMAMLVDAP